MEVTDILLDKILKPKEKTELLSIMLMDHSLSIDQLIGFAQAAKASDMATCIESIEYVSKNKPGIVTAETFDFVTQSLAEKAPRVKWESARVIGNTAHLFPSKLGNAVKNLLANTEHSGTVVRWSAAFALSQIVLLRSPVNAELVPALEAIAAREEKNSIRKIYMEALKKISK